MFVADTAGMLATSSRTSQIPTPTLCSSACPTSIAGRAGQAFPLHSMLQGFVCHTRGVELVTVSASVVKARVRSKRTHDVELRVDRGRLMIACSCPSRSFGLAGCKHAWAALLECDRQNGLADLRRISGNLKVEAMPLADVSSAPMTPAPADESAAVTTKRDDIPRRGRAAAKPAAKETADAKKTAVRKTPTKVASARKKTKPAAPSTRPATRRR